MVVEEKVNPNNPVQSVPAPAAPTSPIQDVVPVPNNLGNPENVGNTPAPNPIAGTAAPQSSIIHDQPASDQALDSVLANVSNNIKAAPPPPAKKGFFGGSKKAKPVPVNPLAQQLAPGPTKAKKKTPILPITLAAIAGIALAVAAVMAF